MNIGNFTGVYSAGQRPVRKKEKMEVQAKLEAQRDEKKRLTEGLTFNFVMGLFFTGIICLKIYKGDYRFLFLLVPAAVYGLWKGWKSGSLAAVLNRDDSRAVIILIPWVLLFIELYKYREYSTMIFITAIYLPFYIKGIVWFVVQSFIDLKGNR